MMKQPKPVTIDFEAFGIEDRPSYPPIPVGVSIKLPGKKPVYYGWGHPIGNNATWSDGLVALQQVWNHSDGILCQNGKFDFDVAEVHMGLPTPSWERTHDTMFLLFLDDPHQTNLSLKPSAERLLGMPPEEQDAVAEWLIQNQPIPGIKISLSKSSEHYFGRYIAYAPGTIVGKYADGDVIRTEKLFNLLWKKTFDRKMLEAYDRERKLMPILLDMERQGLPVDVLRLRKDVELYNMWRTKIEQWLIKTLKAPADINLNSGDQLMTAMINASKVDPDDVPRTATGKFQTNKNALLVAVKDKVLLGILKYKAQLDTCLNTFMQPWLKTAEKSNGLIFTTWNQTRAPKGDANVGTRTGRLSSTPNFQNIPKEFSPIFKHEEKDPKRSKLLPKSPFADLAPLPKVRSYITPFPGEILIDRDYSQQEPRILAHFDGGSLMEKYIAEPWIDFHDYAREELEKMGKFYDRKPVKNTNLGLIYGMGVGKLAERNNMSVDEAKSLKEHILKLYPGLKNMYADMRRRADNNQPIRTWGGREYYCEPARVVDGRMKKFDYKLVNVLIQGSAADCTKEAIIRFYAAKKPQWKLLLNVHDQLTASVPIEEYHKAMEVLRQAMESVEFDVKILTEGTTSTTNWDDLKSYDKKGKRI